MDKDKMNSKQRVKFLIFFAFTLAFTMPNFSQYQFTPLATRIMEQYSLTNGQFTSIFSAPMIPALFLSFISGILVDKYGFKIIVGIPIIITAIGGIFRVFSDSFTTLYVSMVLIGFSGGIVVSNAAKIIGSVFETRKISVFVSLGISICTVTMIAAMSTTALLPSTKTAFLISASLGTASVVFWFVAVPKRRKRNKDEIAALPSVGKCLKAVLTNKYVWLAALGNFCVAGTMIALNSLIAAALVSRGMNEATAGVVSSINMLGNLAGSIIIPLIAHKTGKLRLILVISSIVTAVGTASSWLMPFGWLMYIALFLTGLGIGSVLPQLIAINVKLPGIGSTYAGTAGGFNATFQLAGGIILPTYIAASIAGGSFYIYFIISGAFMLVCAASLALLPKEVD